MHSRNVTCLYLSSILINIICPLDEKITFSAFVTLVWFYVKHLTNKIAKMISIVLSNDTQNMNVIAKRFDE